MTTTQEPHSQSPDFDPLQSLANHLAVASAVVCVIQFTILKALQYSVDAKILNDLPPFLQAIAVIVVLANFAFQRILKRGRIGRLFLFALSICCLVYIGFLIFSTFSRLNTAFQSLSVQHLVIQEPLLIGDRPQQVERLFDSGAEIRDYAKCPVRDVASKFCWIGTSQIAARYRNVNMEWDRYSRHVIREISIQGTTAIITGVTEIRTQNGAWDAAGYEVWKCEHISKTEWKIKTFVYNIPMKDSLLHQIVATL